MASWSAENATKAYLQALTMGKKGNEPTTMAFLAALAAGHSSKLMVMASAGSCGAAALALVCASRQTGGHVVCILCSVEELAASRKALGQYANTVEFAVGDAWNLLSSEYTSADFVLMDCKIFGGEQERVARGGGSGGFVCVGYNALRGGGWRWWRSGGLGAQFLPMSSNRIPGAGHVKEKRGWVFEVDESTGEEHFYKLNSSSSNIK
ncbi:hypothetical protein C2S53_002396 [Perilla frutescens var. hirtella]|uniref:Uncharacterized protein n=1 Tax=Perilla frutescens var. hirtella TaxID=608512 RepID=A0AAD4JGD2_PERFH|nr:hypothetical protein C2S53_002396 [Perilla frutescens var. hirtella]